MKIKLKTRIAVQLLVILALLTALISFSQDIRLAKQPEAGHSRSDSASETNPAPLLTELGCNTCHSGLSDTISIRSKAPHLGFAGTKFNSSYLFDYLLNPVKVRQHIGHARMPDFNFTEEESLALTLFLSTQKEIGAHWPDFPKLTSGGLFSKRGNPANGEKLLSELTCLTCHNLEAEGNPMILDLASTAYRMKEDWVKQYLVAPYIFNGPQTTMPSLFYHINEDSSRFNQVMEEAPEKINDLVAYLYSLSENKAEELKKNYEAFKKTNSKITAEMGEQIFIGQNCVACHKSNYESQWLVQNAPDLSMEGSRVNEDWLKTYLEKPYSIRPFGFHPGSGGRMPDFHLTSTEIDFIASYLMDKQTALPRFQPQQLSLFSRNKAQALLEEKLSCLGCHQITGKGGKIGPDLSYVKNRLTAEYVHAIIKEPQHLAGVEHMPKIAIPETTVHLLTNYLLGKQIAESEKKYLSALDHQTYFAPDNRSAASNYLRYCASCHGINGNGKGYNATYLTDPPTIHSDAGYMSLRPDDTLFDGIYAGGYILNKSHLMPPWGFTLSTEEMVELVAYIRKLCACEGPTWSTDNQ